MRPVSVWLERFRRPAGVPEAASEQLDSELMSVFSTLDAIDEEARVLRRDAEREAARRLDAASREADRIAARWKRQADAERGRAEAQRREAIAKTARASEHEAEVEAARLRERGLERIPALVCSVIACLQEDGS